MLKVEIINRIDAFTIHVLKWIEFLDNHAESHEMSHRPEVFMNRLRHQKNEKLFFVIVMEDDNIVAIAPFYRVAREFQVEFGVMKLFSLPASVLKIHGNGIVVKKDGHWDRYYKVIFDSLSKFQKDSDIIRFDSLAIPGKLWDYLQGTKNSLGYSLVMHSPKMGIVRQLEIKGSFDDYLGKMKQRTRYNLKRNVKQLQKAMNGQVQVKKITNKQDVPEFLEMLDLVFNQSWQAKTFGFYRRNSPDDLEFYSQIAQNQWLRSYVLLCKNQPVAFVLGFQYHGKFDYEEIGYLSDWKKHRLGNVLNMFLLEDLFLANSPDYLDFGFGESEYKQVLGNKFYPANMAYCAKDWSYGKALVNLQWTVSAIYVSLHAMVSKLKIDNWIRKILKHKS